MNIMGKVINYLKMENIHVIILILMVLPLLIIVLQKVMIKFIEQRKFFFLFLFY